MQVPILSRSVATILLCAISAWAAAAEFRFHRDGVLGTSFDLTVSARGSNEAARVEQVALAEIQRLARILSTYDKTSEVSRINSSVTPVKVAPEVFDVLAAYELWGGRSKGAYSGQLGELIATWKLAEKTGTPPTAAMVRPVIAGFAQPGWTLDRAAGAVTRRDGTVLNVDSFGKGYIISKAAAAVQSGADGVSGGMLNVGGDIFAWGSRSATSAVPWRVAVADPRNPYDNFRPLTRVAVSGLAVSTSAGYARGYRFGKTSYSHILDPRTGFPATNASSATVIARDSGTANALATTLCVLRPDEGLQLVKETPGAECLIVMRDGKQWKSDGFAAMEVARTMTKPGATKPSLWPSGYELSVDVTLKTPDGNAKRPYLVLWIENAQGQPVRTVTLWGNKAKYFKDLPAWWRFAKDDAENIGDVSRATRNFGRYSIQWDGRDDQGEPLPPGPYNITLEVTREHGTHARRSVKIECGNNPAKAVIQAGSEFEECPVTYGPKGG